MNRARSLLALVAAIPLVAACGSGAAGSPLTSGGSSAAHHPAATANPANLVLHLPDVGYGYLQVDTQTESVPLDERERLGKIQLAAIAGRHLGQRLRIRRSSEVAEGAEQLFQASRGNDLEHLRGLIAGIPDPDVRPVS